METPHDATNLPIETLRSLLTILQAGSVTAAAARLRLSQPAVTAQIKRLERLVGGPLFTHTGTSERGDTVARYARKIVAANDQLISIVGGRPSSLRLGVPPVMITYRMHDVFTACRAIEDHIELYIEPSNILGKRLDDAFIDAALIVSQHPRPHAVLSWDEKFVWVASPDFSLSPGRPVPFLAFPDSISHRQAIDVLEEKKVFFRTTLTSRDLASHFSLCENGRGVMVFPERFVPDDLKVIDWLPEIPVLHAGIYVRDGFEPDYLAIAIDCLGAAFKA